MKSDGVPGGCACVALLRRQAALCSLVPGVENSTPSFQGARRSFH